MTASANGRSLELYFIDGKPDGLQTAEVFNWTGHLLMTPRTQLVTALTRKEAKHTGIYLLLGDSDGEPLAYIGEAENLADQFKDHEQKKDWWSKAILVTTGANNLNKAHVRYLEARLVQKAKQIGRMALDNRTVPTLPGLSEAAEANMEAFLDYLLMVLPALRIDMFIDKTKPKPWDLDTVSTMQAPKFELVSKKGGITAAATLIDGEFIVEKGSEARSTWISKAKQTHSYVSLRKELEQTGVLQPNGEKCVFTVDYAFQSPSAAAAVVLGRSANGTLEWRVANTSQTYKDWETQQLADQAEAA